MQVLQGLLTLVLAVAVVVVASLGRPTPPVDTPATAPVESPPATVAAAPPDPEPAPADLRTQAIKLRRGETLVGALARHGVDRRTAHEVVTVLKQGGAALRKMRPDHRLELTLDREGIPVGLAYAPSPWVGFAATATGAGWEVSRTETEPEIRVEVVKGEVRRSLFEAVEAAGESAQLVLALVEIFESDFDFTADTRSGDRFRLLVEKRYADGSFVDYGRILVAQYLSDGSALTGVGFEGSGRLGYYDPEGRSLKKSFLKSPLQFSRITSGFTYARPHPILGGVRPHLAVDYAAPVGTPVWAVADGVVRFAGWNGGNGIQVHLRHRAGYETYYNHLSRVAGGLRSGVRVSQKQVIGYVGSTGLSTGPHLDYRIAKHGRFVNPLSEKFIPGDPIAQAERPRFVAAARALVERLEREGSF